MASIPLEWIAATLGGVVGRSNSHLGIAVSVDSEMNMGVQAHLILQSTAAGVLAQPAISTGMHPPFTFRLSTEYGGSFWNYRASDDEIAGARHFAASEDTMGARELPVLITEFDRESMDRIARLQRFAALVAEDLRTSKRNFMNIASRTYKSGLPASLSMRGRI